MSVGGVSEVYSSKVLDCGFGIVDNLAPEEPCVFDWLVTCGNYLIGCLAD
jgi:hypothetical protein